MPSPTTKTPAAGALSGIRVLDLTAVLLGPYATLQLADLGADVIKVEPPDGDSTRYIGPARTPGMSGIFLNLNRNKRSIALDLKHPAGRTTLLRLARNADVFIHTIRPRAIAALGIDYATLRAERPDIIYCAACGFGSAGPLAGEPAYDDLIQAASGVAALLGQVREDQPAYVPTVLADKVAGLTTANALLAALFHRARTGEGQYLEIPMYETLAAWVLLEHLYGATFDPPLGPPGYQRLLQPGRRPFRAADGYIAVMPYTDRHWQAFFDLVGASDAARDPRFATIAQRTHHIGELYALVARAIAKGTVADWRERLTAAQIPNTALNDLETLLTDDQLIASGLLEQCTHTSEGPMWRIRQPVGYSATPAQYRHDAPRLGAQGPQVLTEAGFETAEIADLLANGALIAPPPTDGQAQENVS